MDKMKQYIWKPSGWQLANGFVVDEARCRYGVWDNFSNYQCTRKKSVEIDGYGFCKQHAKIVRSSLNGI